jgi:hypothetical protein
MRKLGTHGLYQGLYFMIQSDKGWVIIFHFQCVSVWFFSGKECCVFYCFQTFQFWSVEWCGLNLYGRCINVVGKMLKYINRHLKYVPYVLFIPRQTAHMLYNLTLLYVVHIPLLITCYITMYFTIYKCQPAKRKFCQCVCLYLSQQLS